MDKYIITGSGRGLGKALAEEVLKRTGVTVTGISRTNMIQHENFCHQSIDLSDIDNLIKQVGQIFDVDQHYDRLLLINNAGYLGEIGYLGELPDEDIARAYRINSIAPAILMNAFIRAYREHKANKIIVNISSGAAKHPYDGWSSYCSTKAGIDMLSEVAALENDIRKTGVRVISIAPGIIETGMQEQIRKTGKRNFSKVDRFRALKENQQLQSPTEAASKIIGFINEIQNHKGAIHDISDL